MKKKRDTSTTKKVAAAKTRKRSSRKSAPRVLSVGEEIRLSLRIHNRYAGYDPRTLKEEGPSRPIEGIILSVREIKTGQLVPLASGDFSQYVLEVLHNRSFDPDFGSIQNAPRQSAGERVTSAALIKAKRFLSGLSSKKDLLSVSDGSFAKSPLAEILDGWRVVKVRADQVETD